MQKIMILLTLTALLSACSNKPQKIRMPSSIVDNQNYCISIRGNGQRMAALWGALAKSIESYGAPAAMSGGSSATYSMFLTESILMNPYLSEDPSLRALEQSLMLKSLMGYVEYMKDTPLFQKGLQLKDDPNTMAEIERLMSSMNGKKGSKLKEIFNKLKLAFRYITSSRVRKLAYVFGHDDTKMLMSDFFFNEFVSAKKETESLELFLADPNITDADKQVAIERHAKLLEYRKNEFQLALKYFGNYNIKDNANIFVRQGPLNFLGFAKLFNRAANLYAGYGHTEKIANKFRDFLSRCAPDSAGKEWQEIITQNSRCESLYNQIVNLHAKEQLASERGYKYQYRRRPVSRIRERYEVPFSFEQRIEDQIAKERSIIPTTGILIGESAKAALDNIDKYHSQFDPEFGREFKADFDDLRIGYWGREDDLRNIAINLDRSFMDALGREHDFSDDLKSNLFYPLHHPQWKEVFVTSPVEPSLSNLQKVPHHENTVSIGGWMDHLSAPVLKSLGCPRVVTITKGDGQGKFGTGMLKRVLGLEIPSWQDVDHVAVNGDPSDFNSIWGRFYNSANPNSSYNTGLKSADAIICANYDLVDLSSGMNALFKNGYTAPLALNPDVSDEFLENHLFVKEITLEDRDNQDPPYISCFANTESARED